MGTDDRATGKEAGSTFESRYMAVRGTILLRDRRVSRALALILGLAGVFVTATGVFIAIVNGGSPKPLPAAALPFVVAGVCALGLVLFVLGITLSVLRTVVSDEEILVRFGLWGPRIPMASVVSAQAVDYRWTEYGGWGIRIGRDGSIAYVPSGRRALEIRYRHGTETKRLLVGVTDPERVAALIARAAEKHATLRKRRPEVPRIDAERSVAEAEALAEVEAELSAPEPKKATEPRSG